MLSNRGITHPVRNKLYIGLYNYIGLAKVEAIIQEDQGTESFENRDAN